MTDTDEPANSGTVGETSVTEVADAPHPKPGFVTWLVWFVFALLFAFLIWQSLSALFFPSGALATVQLVSPALFVLLGIAGVAVPPALAAAAYAFGRRHGAGIKALLLLTALAAVPAVTQSIYSLGMLAVNAQ